MTRIYEPRGACLSCGRPIRRRKTAGAHFCTCACASRFADAAARKGNLPMTTREALMTRLLALAGMIAAAEEDALQAALELVEVKAQLDERETAMLLAGLPGKNESERKAHLSALCRGHECAVQAAQGRQQGAAMRLRVLHAEASILKAVSHLCAAGDDDA